MSRSSHFLAPLWRSPQVAAVVVLNTFVMCGVGLVSPILSVYAATFSASATMAGMTITLFGIGRMLINFPAGMMSQRFGRRPLLIVGPFILLVGSVIAALAGSLELLVMARFIQGIGSGIYMTVSSAAIATLAGPGERGRVIALYQGGVLLGTGIGPAIGGSLASHFGYSSPFWAYAVVSGLALIIAWLSVNDEADATREHTATPAQDDRSANVRSIMSNPLFLSACMITFGVFFTRTASQWLAIPLLAQQRHGMGVDTIGLALTLMASLNFVTLPVSGNLIDRYGARLITFVSTMVTAFGLVAIAAAGDQTFLWIGIGLLGIGSGLNGPSTAACAAEIVPVRLYGPAMGMLRTCGDAGFVVGPIAIGFLNDTGAIGPADGLLTNAALMAAAGIAFALSRGRMIRLDQPVEAGCAPLNRSEFNKDQMS